MSLLAELYDYMRTRKKLWLAPLIVLFIVFGALFVLTEGSVVAPFIYSFF
jgi:hypothetical protein